MEQTEGFIALAKVGDLAPGEGRAVSHGDKVLALFNVEGEFYAVDATCPHRGGPLEQGPLDGCFIGCPWHGWEFDVKTGKNRIDDDTTIACYEVKIEGEDVLIAV